MSLAPTLFKTNISNDYLTFNRNETTFSLSFFTKNHIDDSFADASNVEILELYKKFQENNYKLYNSNFRTFLLKNPTISKKNFKEVSSIFNKKFIKKTAFTSTKKIFIRDSSKKLQFFVDDLSLDNFVKTNLI